LFVSVFEAGDFVTEVEEVVEKVVYVDRID
jgi:hypothetical protein